MDKPVYILCHNKKRMDPWKCVFLCVCKGDVVVWAVLLLGWSTLGVSPNDILIRRLRRDHMAQKRSALHWKYTRVTVSIFSRTTDCSQGQSVHNMVWLTLLLTSLFTLQLERLFQVTCHCCCVFSAMLLKKGKTRWEVGKSKWVENPEQGLLSSTSIHRQGIEPTREWCMGMKLSLCPFLSYRNPIYIRWLTEKVMKMNLMIMFQICCSSFILNINWVWLLQNMANKETCFSISFTHTFNTCSSHLDKEATTLLAHSQPLIGCFKSLSTLLPLTLIQCSCQSLCVHDSKQRIPMWLLVWSLVTIFTFVHVIVPRWWTTHNHQWGEKK